MKWIKRAVLGIFSCCGCSDWSPGIYKVSGKTGGSKSSRGNIQKEEQIKEIYTTEYQEAVKNGWKQQRNQERIQQRKCWWNKIRLEQIRCLFMSILQQKNRFLSPMLFLCPIAKLQILEEKSIRKRLIPQNMNFRS